jgi:hypothetical protein
MDERVYTFDSFDCAIQSLAPICPHCHGRVIGIGVMENQAIYCSPQCASFDRNLQILLRGGFNPFEVYGKMNGEASKAAVH